MSIQFIVGRAGVGKTFACLEAIRGRLRRDPIRGERLLLLVPEQASLQMERAIVCEADPQHVGEAPPSTLASTCRAEMTAVPARPRDAAAGSDAPIAAAHRLDVLSFKRLAFKVMESAGAGAGVRRALSETARAMALRRIIRTNASRLRYFRRTERRAEWLGGLAEQLSDAIGEFFRQAIDPHLLDLHADGAGDLDASAAAKLHDLHLLYQAYLDYLGRDRLDPSQHLAIACERIQSCDWLAGALLWVDGFAYFSGQERRLLVALAQMCSQVWITLLADPAAMEDAPTTDGGGETGQLFSSTVATFRGLVDAFQRAGLEVAAPMILREPHRRRFAASPALARLEAAWGSEFGIPNSEFGIPNDLALVECPTRRLEVEYAVAQLVRWVQDETAPLRYRDLAIIARDLTPYHDLLASSLAARNIPFFIDQRRTIAHHPLVEWLRGIVLLAARPYELNAVRMLLKTGLTPLADDDADELENHLVATALTGAAAWRGGDWTVARGIHVGREESPPSYFALDRLERVNAARRQLLQVYDPWVNASAPPAQRAGGDWAAALRQLLRETGVEGRLLQWAEEADAGGERDRAEEHRQALLGVSAFLDDLAFVFDDQTAGVEEVAQMVEAGLGAVSLGLAPPMLDQVLVGGIERSRHPAIRAAVILGFNDGQFPGRPAERSILNDDDRALLTRRGIDVDPPARQRVMDEALLAYIAVTRPSRHLLVTWAAADDKGKALSPSPYLALLEGDGASVRRFRAGDPLRDGQSWDLLTPADLDTRLVMEMGRTDPAEVSGGVTRGEWNGLYQLHRGRARQDDRSRRAFSSLAGMRPASLNPSSVARLHEGGLYTSASELELFAACPFRHFVQRTLNLRERPQAGYENLDIGRLHHALLEDVVNTLVGSGTDLANLDDADMAAALSASWERVSSRLGPAMDASQAREAYVLRRAVPDLRRIMAGQRRALSGGRGRPRRAELAFGMDRPDDWPALEIETPAGRRVQLRGFIDRVDLAEWADVTLGIVIDYKLTSARRLELDAVYHGVSLQLVAYLIALAEAGRSLAGRPVQPAAALYVSLVPRYERVDHPSDADDETQWIGTERPRGVIRGDRVAALDSRLTSGRSDTFNVRIGKDGSCVDLGRTDAAPAEAFDALLAHTRRRMGELADGILDGRIAVNPYRLRHESPCSWCPHRAVCRYEVNLAETRFLPGIKRDRILELLGGS